MLLSFFAQIPILGSISLVEALKSQNWSISNPFWIPPTHKNSQIMLHQDIIFTNLFQAFNIAILWPQQPFFVIDATLLWQTSSSHVRMFPQCLTILASLSFSLFLFFFFWFFFCLCSSPWFLQGIFQGIFSSISNLRTSSSFHLEFERGCQRYVNPM